MTRSQNRINFASIKRSVSLNFKLCENLQTGKLFIVVQFLHISMQNRKICSAFGVKLLVGKVSLNCGDAFVEIELSRSFCNYEKILV